MRKNQSFRLVLFLARLEHALSTKSAIEVKNLFFRRESHPLEQPDAQGGNREKIDFRKNRIFKIDRKSFFSIFPDVFRFFKNIFRH